MIHTLAVHGYRSIRDLVVPLERLTVITGANGSGKSSLYRAIRLLADVAQGNVVAALAHEGGLDSTLWAGPETVSRAMKRGEQPVQGTVRKGPVALKLGFSGDDAARRARRHPCQQRSLSQHSKVKSPARPRGVPT